MGQLSLEAGQRGRSMQGSQIRVSSTGGTPLDQTTPHHPSAHTMCSHTIFLGHSHPPRLEFHGKLNPLTARSTALTTHSGGAAVELCVRLSLVRSWGHVVARTDPYYLKILSRSPHREVPPYTYVQELSKCRQRMCV
jgi:hypothetical protein